MSFINKNANMILLFLIILSATSLVGATIFFQMNFDRINTEYQQKLKQLQTVSTELDTQQQLLSKIKSELSVKQEREEVLGEKFTEVKATKEKLETQKAQLEQTREQLEEELDSTEGILRDTRSELEAKKDLVTTLTGEKAKLVIQVNVEKDARENAEDSRDDCLTAKALCACP